MNLNSYRGKRVFVTGHTGFKGSWMCQALVNAGAEVTGYALTPPTSPSLFRLAKLDQRMTSVIGDIRDLDKLKAAFDAARPEIVFHLAAQPLVRESYQNPRYTYETNVMGTVNLLECVRAAQEPVRSVVNITTDKVYRNNEWEWGYRETDPLDGFDPYSNSKSCSELVTHSYVSCFLAPAGMPVSTCRAGNVIGGGDFAKDRIIPDCVRAVQKGEEIIIRNPHSVRPYQHVLEPVMAYLLLAQRQCEDSSLAGWYNIGPEEADCVTTGELVELFCKSWGPDARWRVQGEANAPHEANLLKLDCSRIKARLGWRPRWQIGDAVEKTVEWSRAWLGGGNILDEMDREIAAYMEDRK